MLWVVQNNLFQEENYDAMIEALDRLGVQHVITKALPFVDDLEPEVTVQPGQLVYVCGSLKLSRIARDRGWTPGSFYGENSRFERWRENIADELLNGDAIIGELGTIDFPADGEWFIRPCKDDKAFSGKCFYKAEFVKWRDHAIDSKGVIIDAKFNRVHNATYADTPVMVSCYRKIQREYRFFVVDGEVVTGSMYKMGGRACFDENIDPDVLNYAQAMVNRWQPFRAFVIDVALMADGSKKIVEYNCINSSGFYRCDVAKYVNAIESMRF